ncbi:MAG: sporulation integral membrane protein YlbJ [Clostridiales bacterium]
MKKITILFILFLTFSMIIFPQQAFSAAKDGLELWWNIVLPSLLPFFICSELLLALGFIEKLGQKLEFIMRPLFNLPGTASLALVMGYCSGFPTGAAITASLRKENLISQHEGERLIAFTNNPSPLFILVGVATGILASPASGFLLLAINYSLNILIGIILGCLSLRKEKNSKLSYQNYRQKLNRMTHNHTIGQLLKSAAQKAGMNIAIIGCYLVFFSVLSKTIQVSGLEACLLKPLISLGLDPQIAQAFSKGFWEMTLGIKQISSSALTLGIKLPICSLFLAFGGLSVYAQVAAMVSDTDIGVKTYLICRLLHSAAAFAISILLCPLISLPTMAGKNILLLPNYLNSLCFLFLSLFLLWFGYKLSNKLIHRL